MFLSLRSRRAARRRFRPHLLPLEPRLLLTVQAISPGATLGFTEGTSDTVSLGTFSSFDAARQAVSAEIDWGDGTSSTGTIVITGDITFSVTGQHAYADETAAGTSLPVTVVVTDNADKTSATLVDAATVADADAPLRASPLVINATENTAFTSVPLAQVFSSNKSNPPDDFAATIDWGDGTKSPGQVTGSGGVYTLVGSHNYAEDGAYTLHSVVSDPGGPSITVNSAANVLEAPIAATGTALSGETFAPLTGPIATFSHGDATEAANGFSATIDWGDGDTSPGEVSVSRGQYVVNGSHTYTATGVYAISVSIDDLSSGSTTAESTATITSSPVAATAVAVVAPEAGGFNGPVATFTQGGSQAPASNFSASINWGDGNTSAGVITAVSGQYVVSGSHTYIEDGSYPVVVVIAPREGSAATVDTTATIAEAPILGVGLPIGGTEAAAATTPVVTFTAGNEPATAFTAVIDWGEGVTTPGTVTALPGGLFQVTGTYAYLDEGTYPIAVTVTESGEPAASAVIRATATIQEGPPSADGPGVAGTPAQDYVSQLYRDVLNRPVDRPSSQVLVNLLLAGQPRWEITEPLAHSPEHLRYIVTQAYQDYLHRDPDTGGLDYWVSAIAHGLTDEQLAAQMIASDEFFHTAGGDNQAWVDAVYLKLLNRSADNGGEAYWLNKLSHGQSRFSLALGFATSPERESTTVSAGYAQLLHRAAGPDEVSVWVAQMQAGLTDEELLARIVASDEYFNSLSELQ